ncbi:MAG: 1-deoxy-D-xylulose-5-phosphate synthase [Natronospirillum sp.]|uniref:1-deoxy-D-xylulose-5-phosphate synthase n=1 Tax=Natronospirillum sp. TaxID=2812955 RepID=UPI0025F33D4B|nr:1-deoxy-D-xylulose-5-phosphate synthase [Natronospirillum sp.]MCH8550576.1 1-deoxy-D-xylulose-5-phosphate synthase [Natronospirillum sp.]
MKIFTDIPARRPLTPLLDRIDTPPDLRRLRPRDLPALADELREYLLYSVGQSGGHFGAGLGVVELSIVLHYCLDTPRDRLVWDVGHQAYPHKILTGRREQLLTIRQAGGLAAFPAREESLYDTFGVGHSSTAISAALGMALAARNAGRNQRSVAVVGDGALTAGMAFEALNHAGHSDADLLVVLNDNDMSISENVGGLSQYFSRLLASRTYTSMRENSKKMLRHFPEAAQILARRAEEHVKGMVTPGTLFEELGFHYLGPVDGHDLPRLLEVMDTVRDLEGPQFLHVITQKGRGFSPAEEAPIKYHAISKIEPAKATPANEPKKLKYSNIFGQWLCDMAALDSRLMGITPAMREGSDLVRFSQEYPERYFDVAIAEQHAVTLAAGMACEGAKPVVAIYSTFLQRGYDQLIHDVALQNLDVLFAIDRAGLVGEDGPTHAGSFDLTYLRCIPNMVVMTPRDESELRRLLSTGYHHEGPAAVRYPRGTGPGTEPAKDLEPIPLGKAEVLRRSRKKNALALLAFGSLVEPARAVAEALQATLVDMRFIKPLDTECLTELMGRHAAIVTLEENVVAGGAGSAVAEWMAANGHRQPMLQIGLPDQYLDHASAAQQLQQAGLDSASLEARIRAWQKDSQG